MIKVNHCLPKPMIAALRVRAKREDVSVAELIRRAVEKYLKENEK
jgi:hypothetical protein